MKPSNLPIVALVGPANAGKSTLFNKITGSRAAVTSHVAGTTRDRQYLETNWNGKNFCLLDTAGIIDAKKSDELEANIKKQIEFAISEADLVVIVLDGKQPKNQLSQNDLKRLRQIGKPVILAVNKMESVKTRQQTLGDFAALGIKNMMGVSALSGVGIGDLLDEVVNNLKNKKEDEQRETAAQGIAVAIVGKPNVGKSSILNAILKEERVVVSPVPGTTRASIDTHINVAGQDFTFIDTAGLKKKAYRQEQPDVFSGFQTFKAIRRSDICFFVIDATEEITKQDQRVAQEIFTLEKGCVILANKIDKYKGDEQKLRDYISFNFPFLWMCPMFMVSGQTGQGLDEAISALTPIFERRNKQVDNQTLSEFLSKALKINSPKLLKDQKKPKVFTLHQIDNNPPMFEVVVNHPAAISQQFRKFLLNSIIKHLDFYGTPVILKLKGKDKT